MLRLWDGDSGRCDFNHGDILNGYRRSVGIGVIGMLELARESKEFPHEISLPMMWSGQRFKNNPISSEWLNGFSSSTENNI